MDILVTVWSSSSILVKLKAFKYRSCYMLKKAEDVFVFTFLKDREFRHACFRPTKRNGSKPRVLHFRGRIPVKKSGKSANAIATVADEVQFHLSSAPIQSEYWPQLLRFHSRCIVNASSVIL